MRVLVSGDKHLGLISDGMERLEEQRALVKRTVELLRAEAPDLYVDLGDLFHVPRPGPAAYELAFEYLCHVADWAEDAERTAFLMTGNHDKPTRGGNHALRPLGPVIDYACGGVRLVDEPTLVDYRGVNLLFLPHVTDWETAERYDGDATADAWVDEFAGRALENTEGPVLAFTHLEIPGAKVREDDTIQRDTGLQIPADLLTEARVVRVYAGHIHKYQELDRVTVVGSALHVDFGESADPKGIVSAVVEV